MAEQVSASQLIDDLTGITLAAVQSVPDVFRLQLVALGASVTRAVLFRPGDRVSSIARPPPVPAPSPGAAVR